MDICIYIYTYANTHIMRIYLRYSETMNIWNKKHEGMSRNMRDVHELEPTRNLTFNKWSM